MSTDGFTLTNVVDSDDGGAIEPVWLDLATIGFLRVGWRSCVECHAALAGDAEDELHACEREPDATWKGLDP